MDHITFAIAFKCMHDTQKNKKQTKITKKLGTFENASILVGLTHLQSEIHEVKNE